MTHDPLCYMTDCTHPDPHGDFKATCGHCTAYCVCDLIAKVRADEQERQVTRLREQGVTVYSLSVSDPSLLPTLP